MSDSAIQTIGTIQSQESENHFFVKLMNGKIVHGHLSRESRAQDYSVGTEVLLEMTPFDFDQARIKGKQGIS